jgi:CBS domain-containing protein
MTQKRLSCGELSEEDLYEALGELSGYVDVTPGDLREIYRRAWRHAGDRLTRSLRVRDVMTREVVTVARGAAAAEVAEAMAGRGVSGVPVVDPDGRVAGVVSEKDLLSRASFGGPASAMGLMAAALRQGGTLRVELADRRAEDLMTAPAVTVREDAPLGEAMALLLQGINRLPVVDAGGRLVGIVSRGDLMVVPQEDPP